MKKRNIKGFLFVIICIFLIIFPPSLAQESGFIGWYIYDDIKNPYNIYYKVSDIQLNIVKLLNKRTKYLSPEIHDKLESYILKNSNKIKSLSIFSYCNDVKTEKTGFYFTYVLSYLFIPQSYIGNFNLKIGSISNVAGIIVNGELIGIIDKNEKNKEFDININISNKSGILNIGKNTIIIVFVNKNKNRRYFNNLGLFRDNEYISPLSLDINSYYIKNSLMKQLSNTKINNKILNSNDIEKIKLDNINIEKLSEIKNQRIFEYNCYSSKTDKIYIKGTGIIPDNGTKIKKRLLGTRAALTDAYNKMKRCLYSSEKNIQDIDLRISNIMRKSKIIDTKLDEKKQIITVTLEIPNKK